MSWNTSFSCPDCQEEWTQKWEFGDNVTCPNCGQEWETDFDDNDEGWSAWCERRIPKKKIWAIQSDGSKLYVPSTDGRFEEWMDGKHPDWTAEPTGNITFYRELWAAASEMEVN